MYIHIHDTDGHDLTVPIFCDGLSKKEYLNNSNI